MENSDLIVIYVTAPTADEADQISRMLIERRQAACVNVIAGATSYFRWEGKARKDAEWLLVIKTRQILFDTVSATVKECISYSIPEIIALPIIHGTTDILSWIQSETEEGGTASC